MAGRIEVTMESTYRGDLSKRLREDKQKLDAFQKWLDRSPLRVPVKRRNFLTVPTADHVKQGVNRQQSNSGHPLFSRHFAWFAVSLRERGRQWNQRRSQSADPCPCCGEDKATGGDARATLLSATLTERRYSSMGHTLASFVSSALMVLASFCGA